MIKRNLPIVGLMGATLTLSACVTQLWKVTYPGPDNYFSNVKDLTSDTEGNIVVLGGTKTIDDSNSLFIAKYNQEGELIWDNSDEDFINLPVTLNNNILSDSQNRTFYSGWAEGFITRLALLDDNGEYIWRKTMTPSAGVLPIILDLAITNDDQYLALSAYQGLYSYSENGELNWQYTDPNGTFIPHNGLGLGEVTVNNNGIIFLSSGHSIKAMDNNGSILNEITAEDLNVEMILDIDEGGNNIAALAMNGDDAILYIFDEALNPIIIFPVATPIHIARIDLSEENNLCFAINSNPSSSTISFGMLNTESLLWQSSNTGDFGYRELSDVHASNSKCYISTAESIEIPTVSSYTKIYDASGKLTDTIKLDDFVSAGTLVKGSHVYDSGITGEYDDSVTEATLFKHNIY